MSHRKRGIHELYNDDPIAADELVWGRRSDPLTRRGFLTKGGLAAMSAAVGASIPFAHLMPGGLIPAALAQSDVPFVIPGKDGLIVLNDRPINAETPAHLLDDRVTPGKYLFVRNQVHDGPKMTGSSYRVPCEPVAPGSEVPDEKMCIIESMPVKSLITFPKSGIEHGLDEKLSLRGHAWAGDLSVRAVHVSIDFGATWQKAKLERPVNRLAWQHWQAGVEFPEPGYYEVWARATDSEGRAQPMVLPGWNPKGYLNNACHRIAVQVA